MAGKAFEINRKEVIEEFELGSSANIATINKALQKKVHQLERILGRKTMEVEILKEAVRIGREKKLISRKPLIGIEGFQ